MSKLDLVKMGLGMAGHAKKFKKHNLTPRENMLIAYRHETPPIIPNLFLDAAVMTPARQLDSYEGLESGKDAWGVEWKYVKEQNSNMPIHTEYLLDDITEWKEKVVFPDVEKIDWEKQADHDIHMDTIAGFQGKGYVRLKNNATCVDGGKLGIGLLLNGMFERLHALMGFEDALASLLLEPEACYEFFGKVADYKIELIKKIGKYYPIDVINFQDDYGTSGGMFMSLDTWRSLLKPHLARIVEAVHNEGMLYQHHSCGFIEPLIPELIEIGVDALDPLQANVNPNIEELKHQYEKQLTFVGGCNNVEVFDRIGVTEEECKKEYVRTIKSLAPGGSYISYPAGMEAISMIPNFVQHFEMAYDFYK